ncbi:peptide-methionine (S)-S-oxide reductase MsrA [Colwellia demingiae]|uniref:Peptide methionine sulfoxide reductase MsrA n=1 Tax=Colwellia demingiae TaxID=89401 RepID=A0A5C6QNX6_9GAMM|nr:peptide-methionine (S)-S-oxide reductase MsrA [Colwellia demingiae]TWX70886.1 peptide-methionine (S)-S-oxide reductase MsrA [Colwellia demingiae]
MTDQLNEKPLQKATLAGGCFWCIESALNLVKGIITAKPGYMGGQSTAPTYEEVCTGRSGHAEVVQLQFDSEVIGYREILEIFFSLHNPTQLNRQGNDIGTQYRSEVFTHDEQQQEVALAIIDEINQEQLFDDSIVTQVSPAVTFYCGEDYHQNYFKNNPENQYCQAVVSPKLAKFRKTFIAKLK